MSTPDDDGMRDFARALFATDRDPDDDDRPIPEPEPEQDMTAYVRNLFGRALRD